MFQRSLLRKSANGKAFSPAISNSASAWRRIFCTRSGADISATTIDEICNIINQHPFPRPPMERALNQANLQPRDLAAPTVEKILQRLLHGHANGLKALSFFRWAGRRNPNSTLSYELILEILTRMRAFDKGWEILDEMHQKRHAVTRNAVSLMLFRYAKVKSFDETVDAFERIGKYAGFSTDLFNILLKSFCTRRHMKEARGLMNRMHGRFEYNTQTLDILLLGFKESGNSVGAEIFFRDMLRRGFKPSTVTYNNLIDVLCKDKRVVAAKEFFESMELNNCAPDIRTYTALVHGWGIVGDLSQACQVFEEMRIKGFEPDTVAYNAMIRIFCRFRLVDSALNLMTEMKQNGVPCDNSTYHFVFCGLISCKRDDLIQVVFNKMIAEDHCAKAVTVTVLLKYFCVSKQHDLAHKLWNYVLGKGCCPHGHAVNVFIADLCFSCKLQEAYDCCKNLLDKGICPYRKTFEVLQKVFQESSRVQQLQELSMKAEQLRQTLPPSEEHNWNLTSRASVHEKEAKIKQKIRRRDKKAPRNSSWKSESVPP